MSFHSEPFYIQYKFKMLYFFSEDLLTACFSLVSNKVLSIIYTRCPSARDNRRLLCINNLSELFNLKNELKHFRFDKKQTVGKWKYMDN